MKRYANPVPQYRLNNDDLASAGLLYFYENGSTTVLKDTFADSTGSVKNTNPVTLTGEGRVPSIFGEGLYTVIFKSSEGVTQWVRNDVDFTDEFGQFSDYSPVIVYKKNSIVRYSGQYWVSDVEGNLGNAPAEPSPYWSVYTYLTKFNEEKISGYSINDIVVFGGFIYRSIENNNHDTPPSAKWANLTFNNSIAGDLNVTGNISAGSYSGGGIMTRTLVGGFHASVTTSTQSIASNSGATIVDPQLSISGLMQNKTYYIKCIISWQALSTSVAGIKAEVKSSGGTNATGYWLSTTNTSTANSNPVTNDDVTYQKIASSSGVPERLVYEGYYNTGITSNISLWWCQSIADAIQTTRLSGIITATLLN